MLVNQIDRDIIDLKVGEYKSPVFYQKLGKISVTSSKMRVLSYKTALIITNEIFRSLKPSNIKGLIKNCSFSYNDAVFILQKICVAQEDLIRFLYGFYVPKWDIWKFFCTHRNTRLCLVPQSFWGQFLFMLFIKI